jgi:uncharacterized protein YndB with AHSA1/START domain
MGTTMKSASAEAVTHGTIVIKRTYDASPKRVFQAFADPAIKRRWFVEGEGFETSEYSHDFRVGGREHGRFSTKVDGSTPVFLNDTTYFDIVENERIVFAYSMSNAERKPFSASLATIELRAHNKGTELVFTEQGAFFGNGAAQIASREGGWGELFTALERELARAAKAA